MGTSRVETELMEPLKQLFREKQVDVEMDPPIFTMKSVTNEKTEPGQAIKRKTKTKKFSKSGAMMTSYRENVVENFFMRFLHELKSLDSKKAIKNMRPKFGSFIKFGRFWSILAIFDSKNRLNG